MRGTYDESDLASGGYQMRPLEAFMLWAESVILNSLPERKKLVRAWLARYALKFAHIRLGIGQVDNAAFLLKIGLYKIGVYKPCP